MDTPKEAVTLSDNAAGKIKELIAGSEAGEQALRVAVKGGGCCGCGSSFQVKEDAAEQAATTA